MQGEQFNAVVEMMLERTKKVLVKKGKEYTMDGDRLGNFKRAAALELTSPEMSLRGFMTKHVVSIYDMIDQLIKLDCDSEAGDCPSELINYDMWLEKTTDTINYLILLIALLEERKSGQEKR